MLPDVLTSCAGSQSWCTKAFAEKQTLQCVLAVHQGLCHQELFAPRVPDIHHMDDCLALAWQESGVMEGMPFDPLQLFMLMFFQIMSSKATTSNAPVSMLNPPSLTLLTTNPREKASMPDVLCSHLQDAYSKKPHKYPDVRIMCA